MKYIIKKTFIIIIFYLISIYQQFWKLMSDQDIPLPKFDFGRYRDGITSKFKDDSENQKNSLRQILLRKYQLSTLDDQFNYKQA